MNVNGKYTFYCLLLYQRLVNGRQYDQVHKLSAHYGLTETWLVSGKAGSDGTSKYTRTLHGKSIDAYGDMNWKLPLGQFSCLTAP